MVRQKMIAGGGIRRTTRRKLKAFRRLLYPHGLSLVEGWAGRLSASQTERWARRLGFLVFMTLLPERRKAIRHLERALGDNLPSREIHGIAAAVFQNLAMSMLEALRFQRMNREQILENVEAFGWEHVEEVHRAGRGGIFITGHLGNWELAAIYVALQGMPMNVIARRIYIEPLNDKLVRMRETMGVKTLYRDGSMRSMIRCLKENQFLGILPDQDVRRVGGIFVDFFGRPAYTPVGPALLAIASGAPLLIARDVRNGVKHRLLVDPPVYADLSAPRDREVRRLTTLYTRRLEEFIRERPEQWAWVHRRWRTQPGQDRPVFRHKAD